jgi:hypothetical protein
MGGPMPASFAASILADEGFCECETIEEMEVNRLLAQDLFDADPDCDHEIENKWSGVKCKKCKGWFCY